MPKFDNIRPFGSTARAEEIGKIGSQLAGDPSTTKNLKEIQELPQYDGGYFAITSEISDQKVRIVYAQDLGSLLFLATSGISNLQGGTPGWNEEKGYLKNAIIEHNGQLYTSIRGTEEDPNLNNDPESTGGVYWRPTVTGQLGGGGSGGGPAFPIGWTYQQLPGKAKPGDLDIGGSWQLVEGLEDRFPRAQGTLASDFDTGGLQEAQDNSLLKIKVVPEGDCLETDDEEIEIPAAGFSSCLNAGMLSPNVKDVFHRGRLAFSRPGHEARPKNFTVRYWVKKAHIAQDPDQPADPDQ